MCKIIAVIVNGMQFVFVAWNGFWWNHHVGLAKMHDDRIQRLNPKWLEKIFENDDINECE